MKKSILTNIYLFIALTFCTASISWSADFQKGLAAAASRDYATALREWTPLAEQGNASAQDWLGWLYLAGFGVPQNYKVAEKWYRLAALQGNVNASYRLADLYDLGENGVLSQLNMAIPMHNSVLGCNSPKDEASHRILFTHICGLTLQQALAIFPLILKEMNWQKK
jgi:TPR repeat protein